ncbi:MAG TPA: tRNA dihydrouridine synthase DusB [Mycobacteriales bacterium]|nr:tRNA dihydrouridine synthase DusB [Mycobacteriales bacterium]
MAVTEAGLAIGPIPVTPPVVLAPMAGVTNSAFRTLCRSFGAGLYVSEMVSARALVEGSERTFKMLAFGPDEDVRSIQLYGVDPHVVGRAVDILLDHGVHHIDLNMGCPVPKVTKLGGGAALPMHRVLFTDLVRSAVAGAGGVPVTVKMRIGVDADSITYLDAGRIAADEGVAAVALHARTAEQLYSGHADWSAITRLKAAVPDVPVLGNGDIWVADDGMQMMRETGCDGVVVGRGCLGKPWLFRDLADAYAGREVAPPPRLGVVVEVMRRHVRLLVETLGDEFLGVRDFRKHVSWYLAGYPVGGLARRDLAQTSSLAELDGMLDAMLDRVGRDAELPAGGERIVRGHSNGPRKVALPDGWRESALDPTPPPEAADVLVSGG